MKNEFNREIDEIEASDTLIDKADGVQTAQAGAGTESTESQAMLVGAAEADGEFIFDGEGEPSFEEIKADGDEPTDTLPDGSDGDESTDTLPNGSEGEPREATGRTGDEFIFDGEGEPSFEEIKADGDEPRISGAHGDASFGGDGAEGGEAPTLPEKKAKKPRAIGSRKIDTAFDFVELFIFTLVGVLIVTSFLFRHSIVSGDSMQNTLQDGDRLIISDLFYKPKYGDIVVIEDRTAGIDKPIVKRVIATEGQTVRVTHNGIWVDGEMLIEDYVYTEGFNYYYEVEPFAFTDNETLVHVVGEYYEFVVPEGEIFVLGDHRNNSRDSRYYGTVREDAVLGRLIVKFYPFDEFEFYLFED